MLRLLWIYKNCVKRLKPVKRSSLMKLRTTKTSSISKLHVKSLKLREPSLKVDVKVRTENLACVEFVEMGLTLN